MDSITEAEGICYFFDHAEEAGMIVSDKTNFCAMHTDLSWDDCLNNILEKIRYRELVYGFKYIKTTKMKDGRNNHIFIVDF